MRKLPLFFIYVLLVLSGILFHRSYGEDHPSFSGISQTKLLAAFVLNVAKYVQWPNKTDRDPLCFYIYSNSELVDELKVLTQPRSLSQRVLSVETFSNARILENKILEKGVSSAPVCVLIPSSGTEPTHELTKIVKNLKNTHCLTISFGEGRLETIGTMMNFFKEDEHLRFEVNLQAVTKEKLSMSAQLLKLAKIKDSSEH